ncbi:hypothetical protein [Mangrovihabitans endophyticus]|uniref:Lipoprotein n=1 Tax=Mangrovihabitans endophyticus TaxID=1751298 RepID=A0A8J3BVX5_9ACTN|nr:hypothetical protein [Mangrovihabitans endophyticus]GGK82385.1 hypothetical protein GCM10012284_15460 [Mangrovihabitans endophyticus]
MRHRSTILLLAAVMAAAVAGCGKDDSSEAAQSPPGTAPGPSAAGPSASAPGRPPDSAGPAPAVTSPGATAPGGARPGGVAPVDSGRPGEPGKPGGPATGGGGRPGTSANTLTAAGIGPYRIGVAQRDLYAAGMLTKVSVSAGGCTTGTGAKKYHSPALTFRDGRLQRLRITDKAAVTPAGARVGTGLASVRKMYPNGKQLADWVGAPAWLAAEGPNALLFVLTDDKVSAIEAGAVEPVQFGFTDNQRC